MGCKFCTDPDGYCLFPYYGLAPSRTGHILSSTFFKDAPLPVNFEPDPDDPDMQVGTYTHCPKCGGHN